MAQQKYVKLIENRIEFAPKNKGEILNYDIAVDLLLADGYKPLKEAEKPTDGSAYTITYKEYKGSIKEIITLHPEEDIKRREREFKQKFMETRLGWYRQIPNGYANAPQSIQIVDKYVQKSGGMTPQISDMVIFYECPDFSNPEECTEEWLVEHQYHPDEHLSLAEWDMFEMDFQMKWADLNYRKSIGEL